MTVLVLRKLLYTAMRMHALLMERGYIARTPERLQRLEKLRAQFDFLEGKSLAVHYRVMLRLHEDLVGIIPPASTRYKDFRVKMILLMDRAEKAMNGEQLRILVQ